MNAVIGEIWIATIPIIRKTDTGDIAVELQKRPVLVIDDGRGLIVEEDNRNLHILKLTTQYDRYKRKKISNWKAIGLRKQSFIRIEMPIKLEKEQLESKITELPTEQLLEVYNEVYKLINFDALKKMSEKNKETVSN